MHCGAVHQVVEVLVIMYWRLRLQDTGDCAGAVHKVVDILVVMHWRLRSQDS